MGDAETSEARLVMVLDAEPIEKVLFQFDRGALRELLDESPKRNVEIAITDVQLEELRAHITRQVHQLKSLAKALEADGADSKSLRKPSDNTKDGGVPLPRLLKHHSIRTVLGDLGTAADRVAAAFEEFVNSKQIRTIATGHVEASRVLPKYFAAEAPFGSGGKKHEFPDAISIEAVKDFAAENSLTEVCVVSGDPDWRNAFKDNETIRFLPTIAAALQHVRDLDDIAKSLNELLVDKQTHLNEQADERFSELEFSLAGDWNADVENVAVNRSNTLRVDVTKFLERRATIEFELEVHFNAEARYPDDNYSEWHRSYETAHITTHATVAGTAELLVSADLLEIEEIDELWLEGPIEVSLSSATKFTRKSPYDE